MTDTLADHRAKPRRRVLLTGKLAFGDGLSLDCPIREESETGARVVVGATPIPRHVVLVSVTKGVAYEAEVVWRRGKEVGLRFDRVHALRNETPDTPAPIRLARRLWTETLARGSD